MSIFLVIPAKAGIQCAASAAQKNPYRAYGALLDASFRWHDENNVRRNVQTA